MLWIEGSTNPTLKCPDIAELARICKERNVIFVIDNTFMSPLLQNPLKLGADIVYHSCTKYLGGHANVIAGGLCVNDTSLFCTLKGLMESQGTTIGPDGAYKVIMGIKTMPLRVKRQAKNALKVAQWMESIDEIETVMYPGLPSHPHHQNALKNRANEKCSGGSGMIAFYVKGDLEKTLKFLDGLKMIRVAYSLGDIQSLIEHPVTMTHQMIDKE